MAETEMQEAIEPTEPATNAANSDGIGAALSEFDAATAEIETARDSVDAGIDELLGPAGAAHAELEQRAAAAEQIVADLQHAEIVRRDKEDFAALVKDAEARIKDFPTPPGFAERWLIAEAMKDTQLRELFDHRHDPNIGPAINRYIRRTLDKLENEVRQMPDPAASQTKEIVAAAVRGASAKVAAEPPPDLGKMSDAELRKRFIDMGISPGF